MVHFDNDDINDYYSSMYNDDINDYYSSMYNEESVRTIDIKNSLSHINKLIDMAEESKGKIVNLRKQMKQLFSRILCLIVIAYVGMGFYVAFIKTNYNSFSSYLPSLYTLLTLTIFSSVFLFAFYAFLKQRNDIKKQISLERYILKDILRIVFDIRKMLDHSDPTSSQWIEFKVVDMRLKRIEFY